MSHFRSVLAIKRHWLKLLAAFAVALLTSAVPVVGPGRTPLGALRARASGCALGHAFDGSDPSSSNAGSAKVLLTHTDPTVICSTNGISLWEMVVGPSKGYAQGGWINDNTGGDKIFEEDAQKSGSFDDFFWGAPSGTNTYETDLNNQVFWSANFYVNGSLYIQTGLDWGQAGTGVQFNQETHSDDDYWGPDTFSAAYYCTFSAPQCTPTTAPSLSHNAIPTNSFECWYPLATNAFKVYDTRNNGNHC